VVDSFGFDFKPFALKTPARLPVIKTQSVDTRSMKAASLGDCDVKGWVMKMSAYSIDSTDVANTTAKVIPIMKISRAWISSGVWRFSGFWRTDGGIVYFLGEHVCGAGV
jgi:hypothetical protein